MGIVEKYKSLPRRGRLFLVILGVHVFVLLMIFVYPLIFMKKDKVVVKHEKIMDVSLGKIEPTPAPPVKKDTKKPPVKKDNKRPPVKKDTKKPPVKKDTKKPPVKKETKKPPVKKDTKKPPVKKDTKKEQRLKEEKRRRDEARKRERERKKREEERKRQERIKAQKRQDEIKRQRELARKREADRLRKIAEAKAAKARQSKLLSQYHKLCGNLLSPIWDKIMPAEHEVNNQKAIAKIRLEISKWGTIKNAYIYKKAEDPVLQSCAVKFANSLKGRKLRSFPQGINLNSVTLEFPLNIR